MLTATIVLYKANMTILEKTVDSFLNITCDKRLFLVDNSPTDNLRNKFNHSDIKYLFVGKNIGFGAGNNFVLEKIKEISTYHLILNPDVIFLPQVIPNLIKSLAQKGEIAMIAPKVIYPNGDHQFSCRRFPSFFELIIRRLGLFATCFSKIINKGEYRDKDLTIPFYAEYVSGCFQLYKTEDFIAINGFDNRYFMYMEDIDICRKILNENKKILFYPDEQIIHNFEKGSSKNLKLFFYHISSIFKYFYKWNILERRVK